MRQVRDVIAAGIVVGMFVLVGSALGENEVMKFDEWALKLESESSAPGALLYGRGWSELSRKAFTDSLRTAEKLKLVSGYEDLGLELEYEIFLRQAPLFLKRGEADKAIQSGDRAKDCVLRILKNYPSSPVLQDQNKMLAVADLELARAYRLKRDHVQELSSYLGAFARLTNGHLKMVATVEDLRAFAQICSKVRSREADRSDPPCRTRLREIFLAYPPGSLEVKAIGERFPMFNGLKRPSFGYARKIETYKSTVEQDLAALNQAIDLHLKGDTDASSKALRAFLTDFPNSAHLARARFWLGQTYIKMGYRTEGFAFLQLVAETAPLTFYGLAAAMTAEIDLHAYFSSSLPRVSPRDGFLSADESRRVKRAEELLRAGVRDRVDRELAAVKVRPEISSEFLMYLATLGSESASHGGSFQALTEMIKRGYHDTFSTHGLRLVFPNSFAQLIEEQALAKGVDPVLMQSLIKQESGFDVDAVSSSGALGLSQVLPSTAIEIDTGLAIAALTEPRANVRTGVQVLAQGLTKFKDCWVLALAAYNAGPQRAAEWAKAASPNWEMLEFVESIPYRETREYVFAIMRNYYWYKYRKTGERLKNFEAFWRNNPASVTTTAWHKSPLSKHVH